MKFASLFVDCALLLALVGGAAALSTQDQDQLALQASAGTETETETETEVGRFHRLSQSAMIPAFDDRTMIEVVTAVTNLDWTNNFKVDSYNDPSPDNKCPWVNVPVGTGNVWVSLTVTTDDSWPPLVTKLFENPSNKRKFAIYSGRHGDGVTKFRHEPDGRAIMTMLERDFFLEDRTQKRALQRQLGRQLDIKVVNTGTFAHKKHSLELMQKTRQDVEDGYTVVWAWCHSILASPQNDITDISPVSPTSNIRSEHTDSYLLHKAKKKISHIVTNNLLSGLMKPKYDAVAARVVGKERLEELSGACECRFNPRKPQAGCFAELGQDETCTGDLEPTCTTEFRKGGSIPSCGCQCKAITRKESGTCECRFNPSAPQKKCYSSGSDDDCNPGFTAVCDADRTKKHGHFGRLLPKCSCECRRT